MKKLILSAVLAVVALSLFPSAAFAAYPGRCTTQADLCLATVQLSGSSYKLVSIHNKNKAHVADVFVSNTAFVAPFVNKPVLFYAHGTSNPNVVVVDSIRTYSVCSGVTEDMKCTGIYMPAWYGYDGKIHGIKDQFRAEYLPWDYMLLNPASMRIGTNVTFWGQTRQVVPPSAATFWVNGHN